jgi:hypothetical protein
VNLRRFADTLHMIDRIARVPVPEHLISAPPAECALRCSAIQTYSARCEQRSDPLPRCKRTHVPISVPIMAANSNIGEDKRGSNLVMHDSRVLIRS